MNGVPRLRTRVRPGLQPVAVSPLRFQALVLRGCAAAVYVGARVTAAAVSDGVRVVNVVLTQKRLTGFRRHPCCYRVVGEGHAPTCTREAT